MIFAAGFAVGSKETVLQWPVNSPGLEGYSEDNLMMESAITLIANSLNTSLKKEYDLNEDVAILSNVVEQDGSVAPHVNEKVLIYLVNIEKDAVGSRFQGGYPPGPGGASGSTPPLHINLYLMFSANFSGKNYNEALKFLSYTIGYFQRNPVFNHTNSPDLDRRIAQLTLDIENLNLKDLSSLWSILSGKYMPSVLYKVRMITYDARETKERIPTLTTPQTSVNN